MVYVHHFILDFGYCLLWLVTNFIKQKEDTGHFGQGCTVNKIIMSLHH